MDTNVLKGFYDEFIKISTAVAPDKFVKNTNKGMEVKPVVKHVKPGKLNIKRTQGKVSPTGKAPTL